MLEKEKEQKEGHARYSFAKVPFDFWKKHPGFNNRLVEIKDDLEIVYETISDEILPTLGKLQYL